MSEGDGDQIELASRKLFLHSVAIDRNTTSFMLAEAKRPKPWQQPGIVCLSRPLA